MASKSDRSNPVVLITAAGRGIGAGCARYLAKEGYRLVLMSPSGSAEKLADELGMVGITGSMTHADDLKNMVDTAQARFGRIDGVLANTGLAPRSLRDDGKATGSSLAYDPDLDADPTDISDDEWQAGFDMMLLSVIRLLRLVTPSFVENGGGSVVTISTFTAPEPRLTYPIASCIRAALAGYVKLYADRFARDGIRINSVLPGFIENWDQPDSVIQSIPMERLGKLEEIASTVEFLLSARSGYMTGQSLLVDGGVNRSI